MIWPVRGLGRWLRHARRRSAYTLIEILVSTALTLMLLMAVVQIFGSVSESIANSRAALEMADQLRAAQMTLQRDLEGVTVTMAPPRRPESGEGCLEYTEGPNGPARWLDDVAKNTQTPSGDVEVDSTVGDTDDVLLFTTRTRSTPFVGRVRAKRAPLAGETADGNDAVGDYMWVNSAESQEAEVIWFLRGRTLYRRVLLVLPNFDADLRTNAVELQLGVTPAGPGFYRDYDISVRNSNGGGALAANSLSDLTKPENRFAHRAPHKVGAGSWASRFPFHPHFYADFTGASLSIVRSTWDVEDLPTWASLGMPTLRECSFVHPSVPANTWVAGARLPMVAVDDLDAESRGKFDAWLNPHPWIRQDLDTGALNDYLGTRIGEDVVLTNVIGFDVKAWDPTAFVLLVTPPTGQPYTLLPGDRGYMLKLREYLNNPADPAIVHVSSGAYVDLNYLCHVRDPNTALLGATPTVARVNQYLGDSQFGWAGNARSRVRGMEPIVSASPDLASYRSAVYDTWSTHYEYDGDDTDNRDGDNDGTTGADEGTDGFDSNGDGVVDDVGELEAPPPYAVPLRGIQVRIRVFDPASRQIREVTVVQDFLPK